MRGSLNFTMDKLIVRNDTLKTRVIALKEKIIDRMRALNTRIEKLEGELAVSRATVGKGVLDATLNR